MRLVELPHNVRGHLYLDAMPGQCGPIEEFLNDIVGNKISCIVCLASPDEIRQRSPAYAKLLTGIVPWEHITFPIPNSSGPAEHSLKSLPQAVVKRLRDGKNVLIHCNSGIGRESTVAVAVLLSLWPEVRNPASSALLEAPKRYVHC
jgi:protein-tyrosine phosphatase